MAPLQDETTPGADEYINFLNFLSSVHGKTMENVVAIIGDNCNVNQSISNKLSIPLIGCSSHRFQLAIKDFLQDYGQLLMQVHNPMVKLRTSLLSTS